MDPFEAKSIAVLTLLLVLGIFQQSADRRAAPVECSAAAQDPAGTLSGTVSDISGAGISGASITGFDASFNTYIDGLRGGNGMGEETFGLESVEVFLPQTGIVYDGSPSGAFADPEKGDQWEFGVKTFLFSGRMVNTFSVYRLTRNNVLTLDPNHPNFYVVTGTQRSKGVELESVLQPRESWNLILAYAFTDARVVTDTVIPSGTRTQNVPRHSTNLWTTYELPRGSLRGAGFRLRRPLLHEPVRRSTAHILHSRLWCDGRLDFLSPRAFGLAAKRI